MTALQYFACSSSAFGMQEKGGRELIVAFIKSKSDQKQGCIDIIRAAIKELRDSGTVYLIPSSPPSIIHLLFFYYYLEDNIIEDIGCGH